jgi:hypothetical protein
LGVQVPRALLDAGGATDRRLMQMTRTQQHDTQILRK